MTYQSVRYFVCRQTRYPQGCAHCEVSTLSLVPAGRREGGWRVQSASPAAGAGGRRPFGLTRLVQGGAPPLQLCVQTDSCFRG